MHNLHERVYRFVRLFPHKTINSIYRLHITQLLLLFSFKQKWFFWFYFMNVRWEPNSHTKTCPTIPIPKKCNITNKITILRHFNNYNIPLRTRWTSEYLHCSSFFVYSICLNKTHPMEGFALLWTVSSSCHLIILQLKAQKIYGSRKAFTFVSLGMRSCGSKCCTNDSKPYRIHT